MVQIDNIIDQSPTPQLVAELAEARIRNLMCFRELESFNNTGKFLFKHPLLVFKTERQKLEELLRDNPDQFLNEYANCRENVKRYTSYLKSPKYTKERQDNHRVRLEEHNTRLDLFKDIMKSKQV